MPSRSGLPPGPQPDRRRAAPEPPLLPLLRGKARSGRIAGGQVRVFETSLREGDYLHVSVAQQGIDVTVDVVGPGGRRIMQVDSPCGTRCREQVHLVAEVSGRYLLAVAAPPGAGAGGYRARIEALHRASARERSRAGGERAFHNARVLSGSGGDVWRVIALYERAVRLFQEAGEPERQALALLSLGRQEFGDGRFRDAGDLFRRAGRLYRATGNRRYQAIAWNELGRADGSLGRYAAARSAFSRALEGWRALPGPAGEASTLTNLGELEQVHGRSWPALEAFKTSRELWRQLGDAAGEANALNGIGWVYRSLGDWDRARTAHLSALRLIRGTGDRNARAIGCTQIGQVFLDSGAPQRALPWLLHAWSLERAGTSPGARAVTLNSLGLCELWLGRAGDALEHYRQALSLFASLPDRGGEADTWINLGWTYGELGRREPALACLRRALDLARELRSGPAEALALLGMAVVERQSGRLDVALGEGERALQLVESLRATALRPDLQMTYLARRESFYGFLVETLMAQHPRRDFALRALARVEQARSRRLLDELAEEREERVRSPAARAGLVAERRRIAGEIAALDLRRESPLAQAAGPAATESALAGALEELDEVELRVRLANGGGPPPPDFGPAAVAGLQRSVLDPQTLLLELYLGESRGFLWAASGSGSLQVAELPGRDRLEPLIQRVRSGLARPRLEEDRDLARDELELSRILFGPVASQWAGKRLVVAADGPLRYIPLGALPDPSGRPGPLIKSHEIAYIPSLSVVAALRARAADRVPPPRLLAVIGDPVLPRDDERFPPLPNARLEAQAIAGLAGPGTLLALGFDADRNLATSGRLGQYRILHFATHTLLRFDQPELSALILSLGGRDGRPRDGFLRSADVENLDLRADLVVLSACRSALGPEVAGEGMLGLARSFLRAGSQRVLVSLWETDDRAAAELMQQFYRRLLVEHLPPSRALREAQLFMLHDPPWESPYYWAGFVLEGDWT